MSDRDESELWRQMDAGLQDVIREGAAVAKHAAIPRAELERHMAEAHGILAHAAITDDRRGFRVTSLDSVREGLLRAGHWRLHELGVDHRPVAAAVEEGQS